MTLSYRNISVMDENAIYKEKYSHPEPVFKNGTIFANFSPSSFKKKSFYLLTTLYIANIKNNEREKEK